MPEGHGERSQELAQFMMVVRRALLMVVRYIEREYGWAERPRRKQKPTSRVE